MIIFLLILVNAFCNSIIIGFILEKQESCVFLLNKDFPIPTPIILKYSKNPEILYPNEQGLIRLNKNEKIRLLCKGTNFFPKCLKTRYDVTATCYGKSFLKIENRIFNFTNLKCIKYPKSDCRIIGTKCYNSNPNTTSIDIGFEIDNKFLKQYKVCFNNYTKTSIFSSYNRSMLINGYQSKNNRPSFNIDYYNFDIESSYYWKNERKILAKILKSEDLANLYVQNQTNKFLARGHLTPKADFVYGFEQAATMYYINVAPQWQQFNGGNWEGLETAIRRLLKSKNGHKYMIITGLQGKATLPDIDGVDRKLYLHFDKNNNHTELRVPKFYWKIVYRKSDEDGVVFIGINNPYLKSISEDYKICRNMCDQLDWLKWNIVNSIENGYIYCCYMNEFLTYFGQIDFI